MNWNDQENVDCRQLCSFHANGLAVEIEAAVAKPAEGMNQVYRLTVGNLFGSESVWFSHLEGLLISLQMILDRGSKPIVAANLPGFIRQEFRAKRVG